MGTGVSLHPGILDTWPGGAGGCHSKGSFLLTLEVLSSQGSLFFPMFHSFRYFLSQTIHSGSGEGVLAFWGLWTSLALLHVAGLPWSEL